jgi:hypothetical protein
MKKVTSIFDGWTSANQCFGPVFIKRQEGGTQWCAYGAGYVRHTTKDDASGYFLSRYDKDLLAKWRETCVRLQPLLLERFPELEPYRRRFSGSRTADMVDTSTCLVMAANDDLHVPAETFRSLDIESQEMEQRRHGEDIRRSKAQAEAGETSETSQREESLVRA